MEDHGRQHGHDIRDGGLDAERYREPSGDVPDWFLEFERCSDWIRDALEHGGGTHWLSDVADMVHVGRAQLWPGRQAAVVTEVIEYPRKRTLNFWLAGGDLAELQQMEQSVSVWAEAIGCERMITTGRRGWDKTFLTKEAGYEPRWWVLAKELKHG